LVFVFHLSKVSRQKREREREKKCKRDRGGEKRDFFSLSTPTPAIIGDKQNNQGEHSIVNNKKKG